MRIWHIYQYRLGEPWGSGWRPERSAHIYDMQDAMKPHAAKVEAAGWRLVFESDHVVVKFHDSSGITQIWVPEGDT